LMTSSVSFQEPKTLVMVLKKLCRRTPVGLSLVNIPS
jgi:hypothetical protein